MVKGVAHKMLSSTRIFSIDLSAKLEELENLAEERKHTAQIPGKVKAIDSLLTHILDEIKVLLPQIKV